METANNKRVWFVTGASSGFGKELVNEITTRGEIAVATFRKENQAQEFTNLDEGKLGVVVDVTQNNQIKTGIETAIAHFGKIDILVNNAGYGSIGSIEEVSEDEVRRQMDINLISPVNLIKAVLPFMRKERSGHIINITSVGGVIGFTASGIYNASKFALEGIGHSLVQQVKHLGIKVTNVEPGPFRTNWAGASASYEDTKIEDYKASVGENLAWMKSINGKQAGDPTKAAKAIYEMSHLDNPPLLFPLGEYAYQVLEEHYQFALQNLKDVAYLGRPTDFLVEAVL
ncbi:SDR family NAD(P)-dependent oxidoreductase [Aquimarina sp. U1-2]|uniref:oxidoreductase n=1 Tax=Aquimarina sp. U1-2 TaxID=2823141 RepID=UPI001AECC261|nr:oxidoreductase [Aquimarina sp. U1-2]MBP2831057.1 SDR family NAD(P)-dependent oxidoreductase [Aquimarina sp. U1-2]